MANEKRLNTVKVQFWLSQSLVDKIDEYCENHDNMKRVLFATTAFQEFLNKDDISEAKRAEASNWEAEREFLLGQQKDLVAQQQDLTTRINDILGKIGEQKTTASSPELKHQVKTLVKKTCIEDNTRVDYKEIAEILGKDRDVILDVLGELKIERVVKITPDEKVILA